MAAIMADATNSGVERMAESSRGVTLHQMMLMIERHVRPETYAAATAALVDAQHAQPFAAIWGDGRASSSDGQFFPAGGLNLVVNAIILWNTVYLSRAVRFVREQGIDIQDRLLAQVAPIPWGPIGITGDYLWNEIDHPLERFRPLRTNHFNPKAFVFP